MEWRRNQGGAFSRAKSNNPFRLADSRTRKCLGVKGNMV
jgi:hypothetical protein